MFLNPPKNSRDIEWTKHVFYKMNQYQLSEDILRKLLRDYDRKESGIAINTIAICKQIKSQARITEIWMMYQKINKQKTRVITAWRYPGISRRNKQIPIPEDIMDFVNNYKQSSKRNEK